MRKYYDILGWPEGGGEQPEEQIPEEFLKWADANATEKHYCGGDLPDSYIYEAAAANAAYQEGALDTYRHLSQKKGEESHNLRKQIEEQRTMHNKDIKNLEKQLEDATIHLKEKSLSNRLLREKKEPVLRWERVKKLPLTLRGEVVAKTNYHRNILAFITPEGKLDWRNAKYVDEEVTHVLIEESLPEDTSEPLTDKSPAEMSEELFDEYSERIGNDIFSLEEFAGTSVVTRGQFKKCMVNLLTNNVTK